MCIIYIYICKYIYIWYIWMIICIWIDSEKTCLIWIFDPLFANTATIHCHVSSREPCNFHGQYLSCAESGTIWCAWEINSLKRNFWFPGLWKNNSWDATRLVPSMGLQLQTHHPARPTSMNAHLSNYTHKSEGEPSNIGVICQYLW